MFITRFKKSVVLYEQVLATGLFLAAIAAHIRVWKKNAGSSGGLDETLRVMDINELVLEGLE